MSAPLRRLWWIGGLTVVLGAVVHLVYWYVPRVRPAPVRESDEAARLLDAEGYDWAAWIPYPHQNLAVLSRVIGDVDGALADLATAVGRPRPGLGRFGPWRVPPSRALAVAAGGEGEFATVAEVYPTVRWIARGAGIVADNPWLRGGSVRTEGGPVEIDWRGGAWTLTSSAPEPVAASGVGVAQAAPLATSGAVSAVLRLEPSGCLPGGHYALRFDEQGATLASGALASRSGASEGLQEVLSVSARLGLAGLAIVADRDGLAALLVPRDGVTAGSLPSVGRLVRGESDALLLPLADGAADLGFSPLTSRVDGWRLEAWDRSALRRAYSLLPVLRRLPAPERPECAAWVDVEASGRHLNRVASILETLPLVPPEIAERWAAAARLADRIGPARIEFVAGRRHARMEIRQSSAHR